MVRLSQRITQLENEVHQAMAVMDTDTGKLLNYRQLMRSTKNRRSMEPFISQRIWKISKWHRWQNKKSHQHHRVHMPTQSTNRTDERNHIWAIHVHGATRKGTTQLNAVHCRGRQNQLPRRSRHPNSGNAGGKNALQQHNLHEGCTLHDNGHLKLLLNDTATPSQIHSIETKQHT